MEYDDQGVRVVYHDTSFIARWPGNFGPSFSLDILSCLLREGRQFDLIHIKYYGSVDILVLPSLSDPWGIVINEAMAFGLPIISTDAAGATYDLVKDGVNGFVIKAGSSDELYVALKNLCDSAELRQIMGERSLEIIQDYTPEKWAKAFVAAVETILGYNLPIKNAF